jgi:hypothetical protein
MIFISIGHSYFIRLVKTRLSLEEAFFVGEAYSGDNIIFGNVCKIEIRF